MTNYSDYDPRIFPINGDVAPAEIDRAQGITPGWSGNRTRKNEIGRTGAVGYKKGIPELAYGLTQLEYGSLEFWRKMANKPDATVKITLDDFKTSQFDICAYLTDDDGTFTGTILYPKLRVNGFNFSIGDPEADGERTFDLIGEKAIQWKEDNKYFIFKRHEAGSGSDDVIDLSANTPAVIPDKNESGATDEEKYIYRVLRVRGSTTTELTATDDFTYDPGAKELTIDSITTADVIKVYHTSATAVSSTFTNNDSDPVVISAESIVIEIASAERLYRLQSINLDVTFERQDEGEIGNKEKVLRGISDKTVSITLGKLIEDFDLEDALRGVASDYGQIDFDKFTDDVTITVKIYEDDTQETFKLGFQATGLAVDSSNDGVSVGEYTNREFTLIGDNLFVTSDITEL